MPTLSRIRIYPIKSLDGLDLTSSEVLSNGALSNDRRFQLVDLEGQVINAKRTASLHSIRCQFADDVTTVQIRLEGHDNAKRFKLPDELSQLAGWIGDAIGQHVEIQEKRSGGFPDDTDAPGPTVISRASLVRIASWFSNLDEHQVRQRMRANLELDGCEPFWEDQLFSAHGEVPFQVGQVPFFGVNPCARCVVPSRDPYTGERIEQFRERFSQLRGDELPRWAARERFNHFYRFAVNTRGFAVGTVRVGDDVHIDRVLSVPSA